MLRIKSQMQMDFSLMYVSTTPVPVRVKNVLLKDNKLSIRLRTTSQKLLTTLSKTKKIRNAMPEKMQKNLNKVVNNKTKRQ